MSLILSARPDLKSDAARLVTQHFPAGTLTRLLDHDSVPLGLTAIPDVGARRWADARVGYVVATAGVARVLTWDQVVALSRGEPVAELQLEDAWLGA